MANNNLMQIRNLHLNRNNNVSTTTILSLLTHLLGRPHSLLSVLITHAKILKSGFSLSTTTCNHLINAYLRFGAALQAELVLRDLGAAANVVSWTSLISGNPSKAFSLFPSMLASGVSPNAFTFSAALSACSSCALLKPGLQLHAMAEISGFTSDLVVSTSLIAMYGKTSVLSDARQVFDRMPQRNLVTWGALLSAYTQNAAMLEALTLFRDLVNLFKPNQFILSSVVNACSGLALLGAGKSTHATILRRGHLENDIIGGALVDMYAKCGCFESAYKVFRLIRFPDVVPFTSMIGAAAKHGMVAKALTFFEEMVDRGVNPNGVTFLAILHACDHAGLVDRGPAR